MSDKCLSCGAKIIWAKTIQGNRMPLDPQTRIDGNVRVNEDGTVTVGPSGSGQHVAHFATCKNAASHRKPKTKRVPS